MPKRTRTSSRPSDPFQKREAENYDNPIHSREYILEFLEDRSSAANHPELCRLFGYEDEKSIEALRRRLIAMTRDGQLICNRRGSYVPASSINLIKGRIIGHRDGFGFIVPEDGSGDLFLTARQMQCVFHGDVVLARVDDVDQKGRRVATVVEVLEHNTTQVVGRFYNEDGIAFVTPENRRLGQDVLISQGGYGGASHGQYVVVSITRQPTVRTRPVGEVIEIIGEHLAPGMEIEVAIRSYGIPFLWSEELKAEIADLTVDVSEKDKQGRVDVRDLPLVTIDGEDAKDFDDAVYCERKKSGGWRLYVAIADVSHYVKRGTELDEEARKRGTSVYFPGHVVPMLPRLLSNGLCSLNPDVDRLCMVCEMTISEKGTLSGYKFYEGVMHSKARLTYSKVGRMLETPDSPEGAALREQYQPVLNNLDCLYSLYKCLVAARRKRGAIDFETVETVIEFGEGRKIERITPVKRNDAHKLIEECMLCANVATARFINKHKLNGLLRIHEGPGEEKLANLRSFLGELGLQLGGGDEPAPADYQALIAQIKERPDFSVIQTVMLRSLSQAYYGIEKKGHFGLGYSAYTHFTSPIRRYPDLTIHRMIKSVIYSEKETKDVMRPFVLAEQSLKARGYHGVDDAHMIRLGEHSSMTERRADDATRDVTDWLKCEYLQEHVGERYEGVIAAVTSFGIFVELKDLYVEGLVHVTSLHDDYYRFDAIHHRLVGERTGYTYRLGDLVEVIVARVDLEDRKIDFELSGQPRRTGAGSKRSRGGNDRRERSLGKVARLRQKLGEFSSKANKKEGAAEDGKPGGKAKSGRNGKSGRNEKPGRNEKQKGRAGHKEQVKKKTGKPGKKSRGKKVKSKPKGKE
ncbi:MAG: ribonuclease R [Gammaproteobacteria bacterium]|nr:MAG: ribonuclease R [Pseudomonadota bacterium]PIE38946.1 MAG: ribonuclease R [Gammaproteobacteria bacterium]